MRFGLDVAQHQLDWPELLARVRLGEAAGFDGAWVFDHFRPRPRLSGAPPRYRSSSASGPWEASRARASRSGASPTTT